MPVGSESKLIGRLGYNYTSGFEMFPNSLTAPFSKTGRGDARGLLDGQLRLDGLLGQKASMTLWGKNLTNKRYITSGYQFLSTAADGTILRNGAGNVIPTLGREGVATAFYGNPRQIFVTAGLKF